jgi:hypothetical protein
LVWLETVINGFLKICCQSGEKSDYSLALHVAVVYMQHFRR